MKTLIIAVVIVIGMGVAVNIPFTAEVIQGEREEIMIEVNPEWIGEEDEEAIQAYLDVKQRKSLEADKSRLEGQIEALEDELEQVDKELGLH